jgi:lipid-binding SYLF domain-containing protein
VKTPIQKIAGSTTTFLKELMENSKEKPYESISGSLVCSAKCFVVIPDIELVQSRGDYTGTGLMSCRTNGSGSFTEPLYYQISNLESFEEASGGLLILVTDTEGKKAIAGNDVHLGPDNTSAGQIGDEGSEGVKSFSSYVKYKGQALLGIDLSGSLLKYSSKDTFNAYQRTVVPIDIFVNPQDVPPVLRDFVTLLLDWNKDCK